MRGHPSHFIFEINVGKSSMSDPPLSDIDFKNSMA